MLDMRPKIATWTSYDTEIQRILLKEADYKCIQSTDQKQPIIQLETADDYIPIFERKWKDIIANECSHSLKLETPRQRNRWSNSSIVRSLAKIYCTSEPFKVTQEEKRLNLRWWVTFAYRSIGNSLVQSQILFGCRTHRRRARRS